MYLTHLSLTNFRNFARMDLDVPRGSILLFGGNAQGKTSLLESVYFLATLTSFHADHERQLINFLAAREALAVGRMVGLFAQDDDSHLLEIRLIQESNGSNGGSRLRKEALFDGIKIKVNEAVGQLNAVLFLPQMVGIVNGPPEERRRFLNLAISQVSPSYSRCLAEYHQALTQRNALLRQLFEQGGDVSQLDFWDSLIVKQGGQLIYDRIHTIQNLERSAARAHRELTRGGEVLRLAYQPAYDPMPAPIHQYTLPLNAAVDRSSLSLEQIQDGFRKALVACRSDDIYRGATTIGPHRDELRFLESGIDLGLYGSRGQIRTAMLSIKLAEVEWMQEKTGRAPVLLLDEALAELDPDRRADLLQRLTVCDQILLTTTDLALFSPDFVQAATLWHVREGRVEARMAG